MAENLAFLVSVNLGFAAVTALLLALRRAVDGRFAPTWWRGVWAMLLVVSCLYLGVEPLLSGRVPALVRLDTPQAVAEGAFDSTGAYQRDARATEGAGSAGGAVSGEGEWSWYEIRREDGSGREVVIRDNHYVRAVTVDGETVYTVHWTGLAWLAYWVVAGVIFTAGLTRYDLFRRRMMKHSAPAGEEALAALEAQRKAVGCGKKVTVRRCALVRAPLLMGFRDPVILLPATMPQDTLDIALAHELTHLKQKDTGLLFVMSMVRSLYWLNPMMWLLSRRVRRDVELSCDYLLLRGRDGGARRAYGRAILDQMDAGERGLSRLTTGFSGDKKEVFARFRAMLDESPKRPGRAAFALALAAILTSGCLVSCGSGEQSLPEGDGAWITGLDWQAGTVTYIPLSGEESADPAAVFEQLSDGELWERERTSELSETARLLHTYEGEAYDLNPVTSRYSIDMSQQGTLGEVQLDGAGLAVRVQLAGSARLDLTAPELDFTGYCGPVCAGGMEGARLTAGGTAVSIDPCAGDGYDGDHAWYELTLAEGADVPEDLLPFLTGLSSAQYPALWQLTVVDGRVTAVESADERLSA